MIFPHELRERQPSAHAIKAAVTRREQEARHCQRMREVLEALVAVDEAGVNVAPVIQQARLLLAEMPLKVATVN